jgi:hypothetical protein
MVYLRWYAGIGDKVRRGARRIRESELTRTGNSSLQYVGSMVFTGQPVEAASGSHCSFGPMIPLGWQVLDAPTTAVFKRVGTATRRCNE